LSDNPIDTVGFECLLSVVRPPPRSWNCNLREDYFISNPINLSDERKDEINAINDIPDFDLLA
jgi:hypothetical protein